MEYLELPLPLDKVEFIDHPNEFRSFILKTRLEPILGLDCEFHSEDDSNDRVSIIQIATRSEIYIVDLLKLLPFLKPDVIQDFAKAFFLERSGLVVGYSLKSDFRVLGHTHPQLKGLDARTRNVLDLDPFSRVLETRFNFPHPTIKSGLTGLVERVLGKPLDKQNQTSSWGKRPLTQSQIVYAALDAHVLIQVYDKLNSLSLQNDAFDHFVQTQTFLLENRNKIPKPVKTKKEGPKEKVPKVAPTPINDTPITPPDLRICCDSLLLGLARKLRLHGVDCITPPLGENYTTCGVIANKEKRFIITKGTARHRSLLKYVPQGHCLQLLTDKLDQQLLEVWTYFNVTDIDKFVFTRCVECNGDEYISMPGSVAQKIYKNLETYSDGSLESAEKLVTGNESNSEDVDIETSLNGIKNLQVGPAEKLSTSENKESEESGLKCDSSFKLKKSDSNETDRHEESEWTSLSDQKINLRTGKTPSGVQLKFSELPFVVLQVHPEFFGCANCGKIYYEGAHWKRFHKKLEDQKFKEN